MTNRLHILERERQRLERLLARNPQWRSMRAAGGMPQRIAGEWQLPGLNRVQANALRQSLVFQAYQDVLVGIEALHAGSMDIVSARAEETSWQRELLGQPEAGGDEAGGPRSSPMLEPTPEPEPEPDSEPAPASAFRTRVKIKAAASPPETEILSRHAQGAPAPRIHARSVDDLTRIRRIDRALAGRLEAVGVTSFAQIAAWSSVEVRRVARELDLGKRIWRENWIEQAAVLAMRADAAVSGATGHVAIVTAAETDATAEKPVEDAKQPSPVVHACGPVDGDVAPDAEAAAPGEATSLDAVSVEVDAAVNLIAMSPVAVAAVLPFPIGSDNAAPAAAPALAADPLPGIDLAANDDDRQPVSQHDAEPALEQTPEQPEKPPMERAPATRGEPFKTGWRAKRLPAPSLRRLTYIRGISDAVADDLVAAGVRSIAEIARWSAADVRWFRAVLGEGARISADQWIEQAEILAGGNWTRHALRVVKGDFSALVAQPPRSVPDGRALQQETDTRVQDAGEREYRVPPPLTERRANTVRLTPPPLPRTLIAAPAAVAPIDFILRGLNRSGQPAPGGREAPNESGLKASCETGAERANGCREEDGTPSQAETRADVPAAPAGAAAAAGLPIETASEIAVAAARPVAAVAETHGVEPDPAATDAAPAGPIDDLPDAMELHEPALASDAAAGNVVSTELVPRAAEPPGETVARPARIEAADAFEDVEVRIVRREPAAIDAAAPLPDAREAAIGADIGEDDTGEAFEALGDEAAVRIVSRRRTPGERDERPDAAARQGRLGYSPEFIARRLGVRDEENGAEGEAYAGYHDAVEEATVTIIRARGSEEPMSSVMQERAANDQSVPDVAEAETPPARKKAFGSRFLRALTGE